MWKRDADRGNRVSKDPEWGRYKVSHATQLAPREEQMRLDRELRASSPRSGRSRVCPLINVPFLILRSAPGSVPGTFHVSSDGTITHTMY